MALRPSRSTLLLLGCWLGASGCATTRALCPDEGGAPWRTVTTRHFVVKTNLDTTGAKDAALQLERFRSVLTTFWPEAEVEPVRLEAVVLASHVQFSEFVPRNVAGFFSTDGSDHLIALPAHSYPTGGATLSLSSVAHELTHHFSHAAMARMPTWLSEGLAGYSETVLVLPESSQVELGGPVERLTFGLRGDLVPVGELWEWDGTVWDEGVGRLYATSWLLVEVLMTRHPDGYLEFLNRLVRGEAPRAAWEASLGKVSFEQLDRELAAHLEKGEYLVRAVDVPFEDSSLTVRPMSAAEVHLVRARLWQRSPGRGTREEQLALMRLELGEALRHAPQSADALLLESSLADPLGVEGARALTSKLPEDGRAWKVLARELARAGAPLAEQVLALEKSVSLAPDDPVSLIELALAYSRQGKTDAAGPLAGRALLRSPSSNTLAGFAQIQISSGDCESALRAQQRAVERIPDAAPPGIRQAFVAQLKQYEQSCGERK